MEQPTCPVCGHKPKIVWNDEGDMWGTLDPCFHQVAISGQKVKPEVALAEERSWNIPGGRWHNGWLSRA